MWDHISLRVCFKEKENGYIFQEYDCIDLNDIIVVLENYKDDENVDHVYLNAWRI